MSAEKLNESFKRWNPMETDYRNTEFNQYIYGPGADLDDELQPARQALLNRDGMNNVAKRDLVPTLVFKHVPKEMTRKALHNICSRHGVVKEVRDSNKNNFFFVDTATVADMEAVLRALENNTYGFKVLVGKKKENNVLPNVDRNQSKQNFLPVPPKTTGIDYENRTYRISTKNHPRPRVNEDGLLLNANIPVNIGLPLNLLTNDAHSLERQGLLNRLSNNKFSYRHGRSFVKMPEKTKKFIERKHKESCGTFHEAENKYVHIREDATIPNNIRKCSQCYYSCDTVCERCSQYYCSTECQERDWPEHRYKCGKPKHLQKTPPSKKEFLRNDNSSQVLKQNSNGATVSQTIKDITVKATSPEEALKSSQQNNKTTTVSQTTKVGTVKGKSPEKPLKNIPKQLQCHLKTPQQTQGSSTTCLQLSNFQNTGPQQPQNSTEASFQHTSTTSKVTSKKLPAALRISSIKLPKSTEESPLEYPTTSKQASSQQYPTASKASAQPFSKSSSSPQNNSKNTAENYKGNMPRSGSIATITAISRTNLVFIRSTTYEENLSYINTVDTLQTLGKLLHPLKTLPKSGEVVIAKFEGQFNRALVMKAINESEVLINFMDYGNIERTRMQDLLEAPEEFMYKPRHAIPVILKDVSEFYMTEEIRKFMHSYLDNIHVEIRYKPDDFLEESKVFAVELIDETTQQNLNKVIMKLSKPVEPKNFDEICEREYLERKILPGGNNVELIVMDNSLMCSGCISCTTKAYAIEIQKFKKDIQDYVESIAQEAYTPRVNELCIAQYEEDDLWYRGVCLETVGDGNPSIHFIDYGNITTVPIESIRRYPRQFTFPIYTADCAIEGLPEFCDDPMVELLEDLIPNGELITCESVTVDEDSNFYILSMPNVIRELAKSGLMNV